MVSKVIMRQTGWKMSVVYIDGSDVDVEQFGRLGFGLSWTGG